MKQTALVIPPRLRTWEQQEEQNNDNSMPWWQQILDRATSWVDFFSAGGGKMSADEMRRIWDAEAERRRQARNYNRTGTLNQVFDNVDGDPRRPPIPRPRPLAPAPVPQILGQPAPAPQPPPVRPAPRRRRRAPKKTPPRRRTPPKPRRPVFPTPEPPQSPDAPPRPRPVVRPRVLPNIGDIPTSVPGALIDIWRGLLDEYLRPRTRPSPGGGPRRGGERTRQPTPPPSPTVPGTVPIPVSIPRPTPTPRAPLPQEDIFSGYPSPIPDPFSNNPWASPSTPRPSPARPSPRPRGGPSGLLSPALGALLSQPARNPSKRPRTGRRSRPRDDDFQRTQPGRGVQPNVPGTTGLTPFQRGQLDLPPQNSSDPCAQRARDARRRQRRRRKECTKWVTKEIRVCQSSNAK